MEKRGPSYTVGGNINWCSHCGEQYGGSSKKDLKIKLLYYPAIPFLGISGKDESSNLKRYVHPSVIAALFTVAKTWKQLKCLLTDEWIKKMWYIYTMDYY